MVRRSVRAHLAMITQQEATFSVGRSACFGECAAKGEVLDRLVQSRPHKAAAVRLLRKLVKKQGFAPETIIADQLGSYGARIRQLRLSARHNQGSVETPGLKLAPADTSSGTQRFKSPGSAQHFPSAYAAALNTSTPSAIFPRKTLKGPYHIPAGVPVGM